MRILLGLCLATTLAIAAGCGGQSRTASSGPPATATATALTVTIRPGFVAHRGPRTFRLTCAPVGGTLPHPAAACRALSRRPGLVAPLRRCNRALADVGRVEVRGMVGGRPVSILFACPGTQPRWRLLAGALRLPVGGIGPVAR